MATPSHTTHDQYIASLPEEAQIRIKELREIVRSIQPDAEEVISYNIPAFKYHGWLVYLSAHKKHCSLSFPPPFTVFEAFSKELERYKQSKSTVQFQFSAPLPHDLIKQMITFRAEENRKHT